MLAVAGCAALTGCPDDEWSADRRDAFDPGLAELGGSFPGYEGEAGAPTGISDGGSGGGGGSKPSDQKARVGHVSVFDNTEFGPHAYAGFIVADEPCAVLVGDGVCRAVSCPSDELQPQFASAGTVTIAGARETTTLTPDEDGHYGAAPFGTFDAGDTISFDVEGAEVPPFSTSLVAPSPALLSEPDLGSLTTIDTSVPLAFSWTGGSGGGVYAGIIAVTGQPDAAHAISCHWPSDQGSGTIPAALLQLMPTSGYVDGDTTVLLTSVVVAEEKLRISDWELAASVLRPAATDTGASTASVTLE